MATKKDQIAALEELLSNIDKELHRARRLTAQLMWRVSDSNDKEQDQHADDPSVPTQLMSYDENNNVKVVEGVYDGYFMIGSDKKKYPVPMNYSSKSKLIPGDVLKLRVMEDGKLIYKLIGQADRKFVKATLSKADDTGKYTAISDEWTVYFLNQAAVTYFKGRTGDEISIIVNAEGIGNFAAIEAIIPQQQ